MNEDRPPNGPAHRSWFDRLTQVLTGEPRDRQELIELLRDAQSRNLLDVDALGMIEGVLQVSEMRVRDIMIPRSQMVVVERDAPLENILPVLVESAHSRFPVIGDGRDEVLGILLAKDLLGYFMEGTAVTFNVRDVLRPVVAKRLQPSLQIFFLPVILL